MQKSDLVSSKIVVSENTATMFMNNERSYLNPQFSYNTTIVELKPFKKSSHNSTVNNYDALGSSRHNSNSINDSASFDLLRKSTFSNNSSSTIFPSTKFDELMFNKIMKQKKFLINKNMRFYQPVKDAEMLVQLDLLRSKLQPDKYEGSNGQFYGLDRSKTSFIDNNDNESRIMVLNNPRNSLVFTNSVSSNSPKHNSINNNQFSTENSPSLTAINNFQFEINNLESEFTDEEQNYRIFCKNDDYPEEGVDSSKLSNNRNSPIYNNQDKYFIKNDYKDNSDKNKQDQDFEKLKKYSTLSRKQRQYEQNKSILTDEKIKSDLRKNSLINPNNTQKNLRLYRQYTVGYENFKINKEPTFISHSTNINTNNGGFIGKNAVNTSIERLKLKTAAPNITAKKNFDHVVRKSRKYRYDNIYKPLEHSHLVDILKNDSKLIDSNFSTRTNSEIRINSNENVETIDRNSPIRMSNNKKLNYDLGSIICKDPSCEYKRYIENLNLNSKKEYPNERYQRIKNKKIEPVSNIINDIPSTLNTMSQIGVPTNIERLLTKGLTQFYTKYSQGRLVDFN